MNRGVRFFMTHLRFIHLHFLSEVTNLCWSLIPGSKRIHSGCLAAWGALWLCTCWCLRTATCADTPREKISHIVMATETKPAIVFRFGNFIRTIWRPIPHWRRTESAGGRGSFKVSGENWALVPNVCLHWCKGCLRRPRLLPPTRQGTPHLTQLLCFALGLTCESPWRCRWWECSSPGP